MELTNHDRFFAANQDLRDFLRQAEGIASRSDTANEEELAPIWPHLAAPAPEVEEASVCEILDVELQEEIAAYVKNFRALQQAVETIRCVMLARGTTVELPNRRMPSPQIGIRAPQQTP